MKLGEIKAGIGLFVMFAATAFGLFGGIALVFAFIKMAFFGGEFPNLVITTLVLISWVLLATSKIYTKLRSPQD
jgi:hypothetical protein